MVAARRRATILLVIAAAAVLAMSLVVGQAAAQSGTPAAPGIDGVSGGDGALNVAWSEPSDTGSTTITAYDLRRIRSNAGDKTDANWTLVEDVWAIAGSLEATVTGADNGAGYDVQVRAVNSRGNGAWSATVTGTPSDHGGNRNSATDIALHTPMPGLISSGSDRDFFRLTIRESTGIFVYTTSYRSGFLPTIGELLNNNGQVVKKDDGDAGMREHGEQLFLWDSVQAGTYYVNVEAPQSGAYTLHTQLVPDGDSVADAVDINVGESVGGILEPASGDEDFYRVELSTTTDVTIRVARANEGLDPVGTLLDEDGNVVAVHDDSFLAGDRGRHFLIREELDAGVYYLKVNAAPEATYHVCRGFTPVFFLSRWVNCRSTESKSAATTGGPYVVSIEEVAASGASFSSARPLSIDESALSGGRIDRGGEADYFSISVDQPTRVAIQVTSDEIETTGTFYNSSRIETEMYSSETDYVPGSLGFILHASLPAGTSYVVVKADDDTATGGYSIRATVDTEYLDFFDTCSAIATSYDDPLYGCQWYLNNTGQNTGEGAGTAGEDINVEDVWAAGNRGEGITIAMVNDGFDSTHEDLRDNVDTSRNYDYTYSGNVFESHFNIGTVLAGLVAARDNSVGLTGVAPRATIYNHNALRIPTFYNLAEAMTRNIETTAVSSNGWSHVTNPGLNSSSTMWEAAIETGLSKGFDGKGALYVFSAGSGAREGDYSNLSGYANYYALTTVCAVNDLGRRTAYSEKGPNLWVCAPSIDNSEDRQGIATTIPYDRYTPNSETTKAATALVSGVAALVRKANPALTWRDVKLVLAGSARQNHSSDADWTTGALQYGSTMERYQFNHSYGFGVVDAKAAVDLATTWTNVPPLKSIALGSAADLEMDIADLATVSDQVTLGQGVDFIEYIDVNVEFTHGSIRDLRLELVSPSNTVSVLSVPYDGTDKYPLIGSFRFGTARHLGESAAGNWTLRVVDSVSGNSGTLHSWNLIIYGHGVSLETPTILTVIPGSTSLDVSWNGTVDSSPTDFDVRYIASDSTDKADANWTAIEDALTGPGPLAYEVTGLTNATSYDLQVRAAGATQDGAWSDTVTGTPSAEATAVPTIHAILAAEATLGVSWTAPTSPVGTITAYDVRHIRSDASNKGDSNWTVVDDAWTDGPSGLFHTIMGLTNSYMFDVQVRAVTANGDGAWSATAKGRPHEIGNTLGSASPVAFGVPVHAKLGYSNDTDVFRIDISQEAFVLLHTISGVDTVAILRDSDGTIVSENDDAGPGLNFSIDLSLQAGAYYLEITGYRGAVGDYVLRAEMPETSTDIGDAVDLPLGGSVEGYLTSVDEDFFKVVLTEETDVLFYTSGPTDTIGTLQDNNGASLDYNDDSFLPPDSLNFLLRQSLAAGTYYLKVESFLLHAGPYTVHARPVTDPGSTSTDALALTFGLPEGGNIDPAGDADYFSFALTEATFVNITAARATDGDSPLQLIGELLDASLAPLEAYSTNTSGINIAFSISDYLDAGAYYVKVTGETDTVTRQYTIGMGPSTLIPELTEMCSDIFPEISDPIAGCQWHLRSEGQLPGLNDSDINIGDVWDDYKGDGITVAIVDSGLDYKHADLRGDRLDTSLNHSYVEGEEVDYRRPSHGTSVAGIIAARANNIGVRGVAPEATIYAYNLLQLSTDANKADALGRNSATTAVYNNSWGPSDSYAGPRPAPALMKLAIEDGVTNGYGGKGSFYVWAGGNGYFNGDYSTLDEYSNSYAVTAVCAVNSYGQRADYSELGANLWVCGSSSGGGRRIVTTTVHNSYTRNFGGTSAAAPMVAGVAALMRDANDALTWRDIKLILAATARRVEPSHTDWEEGALKFGSSSDRYSFNHSYGFGLVDTEAAVTMAETWTNLPAFRRVSATSGVINLAIPDAQAQGSPSVMTTTLTVEPHVNFIEHVQIDTHFAHDRFREMHIELISPSGVVSVLSEYYPANGPRPSFTGFPGFDWDGPFQFGSAKHLGEDGAGEWTLRVADYYNGRTGTLKSWGITLYGHGDSPDRPTIDSATAGVRSTTLAWTAPDDTGGSSITSFDLRYISGEESDLSPSNWTEIPRIWTSGNLSHTQTGLQAGLEYLVQLRAVNGQGPGGWSETVKVTPILSAPTAPSISEILPANRVLGVFWDPPPEALGDEITAYDLRFILTSADESVDSNWTTRSNIWTSGTLRYALRSLTDDSEYDVQVRAVNSSGDGAWSPTLTGTPSDKVNVSLSWEFANVTVDEDAGTVSLQATLVTTESGALPATFSVDVEVVASGSARAPADYTLQTETLNFSSGDFVAVTDGGQDRHRAVKDVVVTIADDGVIESSETVTLNLIYTGLVLPHLRGNNASTTVTIGDNDHVPVTISWDKSFVVVNEASPAITLNAVAVTTADRAPNDGFVFQALVSLVSGTATAGDDFPVVSKRVVFDKSAFRRSTVDGLSRYRASIPVTIPIIDDTLDEPDEELTIVLSYANPSVRHMSGGAATSNVRIVDNDYGPVSLSWQQQQFTVSEDVHGTQLLAHVTTESDTMPEAGFVVDIMVATADGSANSNSDYLPLSQPVRIRQSDFTRMIVNGQPRYRATKEYTVTVLDDTEDESQEHFTVTLSFADPTLPHLVGGSQDATFTITDNDHVPVTLGWEETQFTAEEPTSPSITTSVTLTAVVATNVDKRPESGFTFDYRVNTVNGSALQPADYAQLSTTATFSRGDFSRTLVDGHYRYTASRTFTVEVEHDITNEPNETFTVRLAYEGPNQPYLLSGDLTATVTTTDDIASLTDLATTMFGDRGTVARGDQLTYDWSLNNSGPSASTSTRLTGTLDRNMSFVSATPSGQCSSSGNTVTCNLGTLEVSDSASGSIVVEVRDSASSDLDFSATVRSDQLDRTPGDNTESVYTFLEAPPSAITNLRAVSSSTHVDVSWTRPAGNGSAITGYELERKVEDGSFLPVFPDPVFDVSSYRDSDVELDVAYTYRLRSTNVDGLSEWSNEVTATPGLPPPPTTVTGGGGGGGGFGPAPVAPSFDDGFRTTRTVAKNATLGEVVGEPVSATHPADLDVTYSLSGADSSSFAVDEETGQIRVQEGVDLELGRTYTVNLTATDSAGFGAIIIVMIEVIEPTLGPYDRNNNNRIERDEIITAISDYFQGLITKAEVLELIKLYFAS